MEDIRVREYGLIEVLVRAVVTWGLHNSICWKDEVKPGYIFNSLDMIGSWHNVTPLRKTDKTAFRRIGDSIPADEIGRRNRRNKSRIRKVPEREWND